MSNNLNITQVAENQASPEVPINDATAALDAALTEQTAISLASGNATPTVGTWRGALYFSFTGVATGGRTVTLPTVKRVVLVDLPASATNSISLIRGSTTVTVNPGDRMLVITDGTTNGLVVFNLLAEKPPIDLHIFVPGVEVNSQLLYRMKATRAFALPTNLSGSFVTAVAAATGSTTFTIKKNGSSIGTAVFSAAGTTAALTLTATSFASGDVLTIEGQATADATLADVSFDLKGTLS